MNIHFLDFESSHSKYVWETYVNAMKHHIEKIWGWEDSWQKNNFTGSLKTYSTKILTIERKRAGYIQFLNNNESTFLSMIVLEKEYQSKGYGVTVIDKIQALSPELPLTLRCFKVNEKAYKFYLRNGFELVATDNEFHSLCRAKMPKFKNESASKAGLDAAKTRADFKAFHSTRSSDVL